MSENYRPLRPAPPRGVAGQTSGESSLADRVQKQVIEYLIKKGYSRTEQMLRYVLVVSLLAEAVSLAADFSSL